MKGGAFLPILVAGLTPFVLIALIVFGSTLGLVAWKPPLLWADEIGIPNSHSGIYSITTYDSGLYVAGTLNYAPFLREYSTDGGVIWTSAINDIPGFFLQGIGMRSDGVYAVGFGNTNITLLKYAFNGSRIWGVNVVSTVLGAVVSADSSGVFVASVSARPLTNQTFTGAVLFVREYDSGGQVDWTSEFSNSSSEEVLGIYAGSQGVYVLTSFSIVGYDLNGREQWIRSFGLPSAVVPYSVFADTTGVYVSETETSNPALPPIGILKKYDFNGNMIWNVTFASPDGSGVGGSSLWIDSSKVYLSMLSVFGNDFVMKYDAGGNQLWSFQTPFKPQQVSGVSQEDFPVVANQAALYLAGAILDPGLGVEGVLQAFATSSSLVFFGLNPPFSFIVFAAVIAVAVLGVFFFRRRYSRMMSKRPKSASPDRYRRPGDTLKNSLRQRLRGSFNKRPYIRSVLFVWSPQRMRLKRSDTSDVFLNVLYS